MLDIQAECKHLLAIFKFIPLFGITRREDGEIICQCGDTECRSSGKHPCIHGGALSAQLFPALPALWLSVGYNVGYVLGESYMAVDIDPRNGGDERALELPATWVVDTPRGGSHHVYRCVPGKRLARLQGVDLLTGTRYLVAPGSTTPYGQYEWRDGYRPDDLPIAEAPEWVYAIDREPRGAPAAGTMWAGEVEYLLSRLDPDCCRDTWIRIGMALHAAGDYLNLWDEWSSRSPKHVPGECAKIWRGFKSGDGITADYLLAAVHQIPSDPSKWRGLAEQANQANPNNQEGTQSQSESLAALGPCIFFADLMLQDAAQLSPEQIICGWLTRPGVAIMAGAPNAGKTFLAIDMACAIARGAPWHGRDTRQGMAVYYAAESSDTVKLRLHGYRQYHALAEPIPFLLLERTASETPLSLVNRLNAVRTSYGDFSILVIDTFATAFPGIDENASGAMTTIFSHFNEIKDIFKCCILIIHHLGKDPERGARGHSSMKGAVDTEIVLTSEDSLMQVDNTKQRSMKRADSICVQLAEVDLGLDRFDVPLTTCAVSHDTDEESLQTRRNQKSVDKIIGLLNAGKSQREISDTLRVPRRTVADVLAHLRAQKPDRA